MNIYELTERDFLRAKINFENAKRKPNVPQSELEHLAELCVLRKHIFEIMAKRETMKGVVWEHGTDTAAETTS